MRLFPRSSLPTDTTGELRSIIVTLPLELLISIWAATWQNQQSECAPSEDSDQPGQPPSLIRVFDARMKKAWVLSYTLNAQQRLWSDLADTQADLRLRWAHTHFVGFVTRRLILERFDYVHVTLFRRDFYSGSNPNSLRINCLNEQI